MANHGKKKKKKEKKKKKKKKKKEEKEKEEEKKGENTQSFEAVITFPLNVFQKLRRHD